MKATNWKRFEVQVSRTSKAEAKEFRIERPEAAVELFREDAERLTQESLWALTLDGRNGLMGIERVYQGTATGTSVRIGELFRYAVTVGGVGLVLVHNHPSGDPQASDEDIRLTSEVLSAAKLLDIELLDHLVIASNGYISIRSNNQNMWRGGDVYGEDAADQMR
jgi:DNA repair protein RadC